MDTTQFKLEPSERTKYSELTYLGYEPTNVVFDIHHPNFTLCQDDKQAHELMDAILRLEKDLGKLIKERGLEHDPKKIIRYFFPRLEHILIGIDIRAKWPWEKKVEKYLEWFDEKYKEAANYCNTIYQTVEEYHPTEDWLVSEKYRRNIQIFDLDFPEKLNWGEGFFNQAIENIKNSDISAALRIMEKKIQSYWPDEK